MSSTESKSIQCFSIKICNSECEEPQTCAPGPETDTEEIQATDIQRPCHRTGTQENHSWGTMLTKEPPTPNQTKTRQTHHITVTAMTAQGETLTSSAPPSLLS
ncbi:hypothetical protein GOODEAATRI_027459 [Goodea atripinnis]|uniref:Uncharacterized protein n=1 Tax=Goodea atripinnis TaxID=208336 RepID=A0ABV0NE29_9TELE